MTLLLCVIASAAAGTLPLWSVTDFGNSGDMAGNDGWIGGYRDDPWEADNGRAYSKTDVNIGDTGFTAYGEGGAADNWLINGEIYQDGLTRLTYTNEDDDSFGLVSHLTGGDTFYLLLVSASNAPPPVESVEGSTALLLRVEAGTGEVIAEVEASQSGQGDDELALRVNDGVLEARLNGELLFEVTDPAPLPAGKAGFYAYDTGGVGRNDTEAWASAIEVEQMDDDDDQVADDIDNCETSANTDQADNDNDGLGDACDEPIGDDTGNTDDDSGPRHHGKDGAVTLTGDCACASGKPSASGKPNAGAFALALGLIATLRRRR